MVREVGVKCSLNRWRLIADLWDIDRGIPQVDSKEWFYREIGPGQEIDDDQGLNDIGICD